MSADTLIAQLASTARHAARTLSTATASERKAALLAIADAIEKRAAEILPTAVGNPVVVQQHVARQIAILGP